MTERERIKQLIMEELPHILKQDVEVQRFVRELIAEYAAGRVETESRFDRLLEELRQDREAQMRRWEENQRRLEQLEQERKQAWEENQQRWEENQQRWEESQRRWEQLEQERKQAWEENQRRWEQLEQERKEMWKKLEEERKRAWEENWRRLEELEREHTQRLEALRQEQDRRWQESLQRFDKMLEAFRAQERRHDQHIGALGARWGLQTEAAFRNALAGILEELGFRVIHVEEQDKTGEVFRYPEQIELDLIIHNGKLIIGEIKSSVTKSEVYAFERKARFYEKRHNTKADRLIIISPMVDDRARRVAERLGIEVYSYAEDAGEALSGTEEKDEE